MEREGGAAAVAHATPRHICLRFSQQMCRGLGVAGLCQVRAHRSDSNGQHLEEVTDEANQDADRC